MSREQRKIAVWPHLRAKYWDRVHTPYARFELVGQIAEQHFRVRSRSVIVLVLNVEHGQAEVAAPDYILCGDFRPGSWVRLTGSLIPAKEGKGFEMHVTGFEQIEKPAGWHEYTAF